VGPGLKRVLQAQGGRELIGIGAQAGRSPRA
jgi:hypothetical protein